MQHSASMDLTSRVGLARRSSLWTRKSFSATKPARDEDLSPHDKANFFSKVFLVHIWSFMTKSIKIGEALSYKDLPEVPHFAKPEEAAKRIKKFWEAEKDKPSRSLRRTLWNLIKWNLLWTFMLGGASTALNAALPLLVSVVVKAVDHDLSHTATVLLPPAIFCTTFLASATMQHGFLYQTLVAMISWGSLTTLVLEHPSKMTSAERSGFTEGEVLNLLTADCQAVVDVMMFTGFFMTMPLQALITIGLLGYFLGWPFLIGLAILVFNVWLSERLGHKIKLLQAKKNTLADARSVLLNETFQGIRTVKLYSWESFVKQNVSDTRKTEIDKLRKLGVLRALQTFVTLGLPTLAMVASFVAYQMVNDELTPGTVFASVGFFELLNMSLSVLPNALNEIRRMGQSVDRIHRFLVAPATYNARASGQKGVVQANDASFFWDHSIEKKSLTVKRKSKKSGRKRTRVSSGIEQRSTTTNGQTETIPVDSGTGTTGTGVEAKVGFGLSNVTFEASAGQLVAVVGRVGSGKTTFIEGLLGLVHNSDGRVAIGGTTAFVPQQAFVMNDSFKNNILFGSRLDEDKYQLVLEACALELDVAMLPAGAESEVGEKGITISGGQKQRLAIARAAYANPDVVLLDDPLSAMDAHVGRQVFDNCIISGPLSKSTRIMATNQIQFCEECDFVIVLSSGKVAETGTHRELMEKKGEYFELASHVVGSEKPAADGDEPAEPADADADADVDATVVVPDDDATTPLDGDGTKPVVDDAKPTDGTKPAVDDVKKPDNQKGDDDKKGKVMTKEMAKVGRVGPSTFFKLASATGANLLGYTVVFLIILAPILQYGVNIFLAKWTDEEVPGTSSEWFVLYLVTAFTFAICAGVRSWIFNLFFLQASENIHKKMMASVLSSPMSFFDTTPIGRILNRFTGDIMQLDLLLPRLFEMWAYLTGLTVVVVIVSGIIVPHVLVASFFVLIVVVMLYIYVGAVVLRLRRMLLMSYSPIMSFFSGYVGGLDSIRAFGRIDVFFNKFRELQKAPMRSMYQMLAIQAFANANVLALTVAIFMSGLCGALILLRDTQFVTPGFAGLVLAYCTVLSIRVPAVFFISTMLEQLMSAVQRVVEFTELDSEGIRRNIIKDGKNNTELMPATQEPAGDWPAKGAIELKDVVMSYRPGLSPVLKGVTVSITAGEKVGVVGRTGAGKSSLILALFRMVEVTEGQIFIDGVDTSTVPLSTLRARLGMIPQDPFLFSGTIRSNLDINACFSDDDLWNALEMVDLAKTVGEYEKGLDHEVKEKGENFSAGMVQLFCLARVLLKKPQVIFMDEATASVDLQTDALVQETIRKTFPHCTIVTIAHRLNTVIDYDKVLVMDAGKAVEFGSPHELLSDRNGVFSNLVNRTGASSAAELRTRAAELQTRPAETE